MTHAEDPWILARGGIAADVASTNQIEKNWMKELINTSQAKALAYRFKLSPQIFLNS